jgi:hypothetical protein
MVTAKGRPSGTATTRTVMPVIKYLTRGLMISFEKGAFSKPI